MDVECLLLGKQSIWSWPISPHFHNAIEGEMPCLSFFYWVFHIGQRHKLNLHMLGLSLKVA